MLCDTSNPATTKELGICKKQCVNYLVITEVDLLAGTRINTSKLKAAMFNTVIAKDGLRLVGNLQIVKPLLSIQSMSWITMSQEVKILY